LEWDEYAGLSYDLKLWLRGLFMPLSQTPESSWTEQGILSHVGYLALVFLILAWIRYREQRQLVLFLTVVALFALLWSSDTPVTRFFYHVPVFNKFRWPFKLAYFTSFFMIMVATFGCSYCLSATGPSGGRGRTATVVLAVTIILLQAINILVVYRASPQPMFSRHTDRVPFKEPLKELLVGGRIVSIGVVPSEEGGKVIHGNSQPQLGFNYATLWGLQHFAGYEVLIATDNFEATLQLEGRSVCNVIPGTQLNIPAIAPLEYFRSWGVRWYVVDSKLPLVPTDQLRLVYSDTFRNVLEDAKAMPLVYWLDDSSAASFRFKTNSVEIASDRQNEGHLKVNVLFNPGFRTTIDGRDASLTRTDDGRMAVVVPGGRHEVEIRYHDRNFTKGILISLVTLLGLLVCGYVLKRQSRRHVSG
jgi:hypothetical protein